MINNPDLIEFLKEGEKVGRECFRLKFGVYPFKLLTMLQESNIVVKTIKHVDKRRKLVSWSMKNNAELNPMNIPLTQDPPQPLNPIIPPQEPTSEERKISGDSMDETLENGEKALQQLVDVKTEQPIGGHDIAHTFNSLTRVEIKSTVDPIILKTAEEIKKVEEPIALVHITYDTRGYGIKVKKIDDKAVEIIPISDEEYEKLPHSMFNNERKKYEEYLKELKETFKL